MFKFNLLVLSHRLLCIITESQDSDEDRPVKNRKIMGAPTQAYVCESDEESGSFHFSVFLYIIADA